MDTHHSRFTITHRQAHLENISEVVRLAGKRIMAFAQEVRDTQEIHGHSSSTIDAHSQVVMTSTFQEVYEHSKRGLGQWLINLDYEDSSALISSQGFFPTDEMRANGPVAIIDEIDGTTNVKRAVAAALLANQNPKSAVCIALKSYRASPTIECGAVYALDEDIVFAGMAAEKTYLAFRDGKLIPIDATRDALGDSKYRIIVPCYSNKNRIPHAKLQQAIEAKVGQGKCECYGGCRSSTIDIIDIIRNQYDAYVDCRRLWTSDLESNSVLRVYDIAAAMPIARGAGLAVMTARGDEIDLAGVDGRDAIDVVIGRPQRVDEIAAAIRPWLGKFKEGTP